MRFAQPDAAVGVWRNPCRLTLSPLRGSRVAAPVALRPRYVIPNPYLARPQQRLVAVMALVGHHLFDTRALRLHRFNLLRRQISVSGRVAVSPSDTSCTVTETMAPVSMSTPYSALWARCVLPSFIFATFASGSYGDFHSLFEIVLFFRDRSNEPDPPASASIHALWAWPISSAACTVPATPQSVDSPTLSARTRPHL